MSEAEKECCRKRILNNPEAKAFAQQKILDAQWSPEEIANRMKLENSPYQASRPTIYRAIYAGRLEVRKLSHGERGIARKLRHRGKTRRKKTKKKCGAIFVSAAPLMNDIQPQMTVLNWGMGKPTPWLVRQDLPASLPWHAENQGYCFH